VIPSPSRGGLGRGGFNSLPPPNPLIKQLAIRLSYPAKSMVIPKWEGEQKQKNEFPPLPGEGYDSKDVGGRETQEQLPWSE